MGKVQGKHWENRVSCYGGGSWALLPRNKQQDTRERPRVVPRDVQVGYWENSSWKGLSLDSGGVPIPEGSQSPVAVAPEDRGQPCPHSPGDHVVVVDLSLGIPGRLPVGREDDGFGFGRGRRRQIQEVIGDHQLWLETAWEG